MADQRGQPSSIALDECYSAGDDAFLDELRSFFISKKLIAVAEKWRVDPRPWARRMLREYLGKALNSAGHEPLVKRMFKHAEEQDDHEALGWFLVAFDRVVRRARVQQHHYDYATRQSYVTERLWAKPNQTYRGQAAPYSQPGMRLFSHRTRYYLRRRVWRYFRRLSYRDGEAYRRAIGAALLLYRDDDFVAGEDIIDNWSLMHACYFGSPVVQFTPSLVYVADDRSLGEMAPAPYQPSVWAVPEALGELIGIIADARSSFVRQWAIELVQRVHQASLGRLALPQLMPLLTHRDPRVQEFAAAVFERLAGLESLGIDTWLTLLETDNLAVQTMLCEAMSKHVAPERFDKRQLIELTNKSATPVSRMGFELLKKRHADAAYAPAELAELADARCQVTSGEIAAWALAQIGDEARYDVDLVVRFYDSLQEPARRSALAWLEPESAGWGDPALWVKLIETPFPDVRDVLIDRLEARVRFPGADTDQLAPLWTTVILSVHRGGRRKPKAVRQIVGAIQRKPSRAEKLAPVLAFAVRSIRGPERRSGLAAVASLAESRPALHELLSSVIPELQLPAPLATEGAA